MAPLKLEIFGRTVLVERRVDGWEAFYLGSDGKRRRAEDLIIPSTILEEELEAYLADLCHEWATPRNPRVVRVR
jgi:hypothetical protein